MSILLIQKKTKKVLVIKESRAWIFCRSKQPRHREDERNERKYIFVLRSRDKSELRVLGGIARVAAAVHFLRSKSKSFAERPC